MQGRVGVDLKSPLIPLYKGGNKFPMPKTPKKPTLEEKLNEKLIAVWQSEEEARAKLLAAKLNLPYISLTAMPIDSDALFLISAQDAQAGNIAVIGKTDKNLKII